MRLFKPNVPKMLAKKDLHGLIEALGDEDPNIVDEAATALSKLGDARTGDLLLEALEKPASRVGAIIALGLTHNLRAMVPIVLALKDKDVKVRWAAAFAVPMMPHPFVIEPLAAALHDVDQNVRFEAATSLEMMHDPRGVDYMIKLLEKRDILRSDAAKFLGEHGGTRAVESLLAAIHDTDFMLRMAASEALGKLKDPASIEPLRAAIKDANQDVRLAAADALEAITGEHHFVFEFPKQS
jgi:HEAT repeat protein